MKRILIPLVILILMLSTIHIFPNTSAEEKASKVAFLVNSSIYPEIKDELSKISERIGSYDFVMKEIKNQTPSQIRAWLKMEHENYGLVGAVLIGDIPIPEYHNPVFNETVEFPYFYMNLNASWNYDNGIIASQPENYSPDIWIGIVRSTDMYGNNITQINGYIHRVVEYLDGKISTMPRSLGFVDDDFLTIVDKLRLSLSYPYVGYDLIDKNTSKAVFLRALSGDYPYAFIIAHSTGNMYTIKDNVAWEYVHPWEIRSNVLFYTDQSCHAGDFEKGAIANYLIMAQNSRTLGVLTFTGMLEINSMNSYHMALSEGKTFGDAMLTYIKSQTHNTTNFNSHIAMLTYLGFPFLRPWRPGGYREVGPLDIESNSALLSYAKKYGWPGDGSRKNPITIENMMVFAPYTIGGITLGNISLYVEISHSYVLVGNGYGISVGYAAHVKIENNTLYYANIFIADSSNISIENNTIHWGYSFVVGSIALDNTSWARILNNRVINGFGIRIAGKLHMIREGQRWIMKPYYVRDVQVSGNVLENVLEGIGLFFLNDSKIYRNVVDFSGCGLIIQYSSNNKILENNFTLHFSIKDYLFGSMFYVSLYNSFNNSIYLNNFFYLGNVSQYMDFHQLFIAAHSDFNSSTPINYWNNSKYGNYYQWWAGKNDTNDENKDGIVDYPWVIDENNTDYRPLKKPVVWNVGTRESGGVWNVSIFATLLVVIVVAVLAIIYVRRRRNF